MPPDDLRLRTKTFATDIVQFCRRLPTSAEAMLVRRQLLRAATGVAANYRAACRPRSDADFVAKLGMAIEECDEAALWLEVARDVQRVTDGQRRQLRLEADELTRILAASRETVRRRVLGNEERPAP